MHPLPPEIVHEILLYLPLEKLILLSSPLAKLVYNELAFPFNQLILDNNMVVMEWLNALGYELKQCELVCELGRLEMLKLYPTIQFTDRMLSISSCHGHVECAAYLLQFIPVNNTTVDVSVCGNSVQTVELLLQNGFMFSMLGINNCVRGGNVELLELLLKNTHLCITPAVQIGQNGLVDQPNINTEINRYRPSIDSVLLQTRSNNIRMVEYLLSRFWFANQELERILECCCEKGLTKMFQMVSSKIGTRVLDTTWCLLFARANQHHGMLGLVHGIRS